MLKNKNLKGIPIGKVTILSGIATHYEENTTHFKEINLTLTLEELQTLIETYIGTSIGKKQTILRRKLLWFRRELLYENHALQSGALRTAPWDEDNTESSSLGDSL